MNRNTKKKYVQNFIHFLIEKQIHEKEPQEPEIEDEVLENPEIEIQDEPEEDIEDENIDDIIEEYKKYYNLLEKKSKRNR